MRPKLCADFRCAWLADASWPEAWRPDRSGLLCLREKIGGSFPAAAVYELFPGALQRRQAAQIVEELQKATAILVTVDVDGRRRRLVGQLLGHGAQGDVRHSAMSERDRDLSDEREWTLQRAA